jgi:hypothetical protein
MNSPQFVSRINAELRPVLGDDRIITGARMLATPSRRALRWLSSAVYLASAVALGFVYLWARDDWHVGPALIGFGVAEAAALVLGLVRIFVQRPMLLVVTRRQLVYCRLSGPGKHTADVAAAPLARARIILYKHGRADTTLRCVLPGFEPVRLSPVKGCQEDLDRVLAVAHSSGVGIQTAEEASAGTAPPNPRPGSTEGRSHRDSPEGRPRRDSGRNTTYRNRDWASGPLDRGGRLGRDRPSDAYRIDGRTAARPERRREHPGEHRRSGRGGGEPTRS